MAIPLKQRIGIRLRSMRERAGLTQERLAALVDRTPETISNIERGHTLPSLATLEDLSRHLEALIREFLDEEVGEGKASRRRLELELRLRGLAAALPDDDLEIACEQVEAVAKRAHKKGEKWLFGGNRLGPTIVKSGSLRMVMFERMGRYRWLDIEKTGRRIAPPRQDREGRANGVPFLARNDVQITAASARDRVRPKEKPGHLRRCAPVGRRGTAENRRKTENSLPGRGAWSLPAFSSADDRQIRFVANGYV